MAIPRPGVAEAFAIPAPYNVRVYALDRVRSNFPIDIPGDTITLSTKGTYVGITVKFDSPTNDAIPCDRFNPIDYPAGFKRFYLSHTAQTGETLFVFIGRAAGARAVSERTVAAPKPIFYTIVTDKDTHFVGALITGNKEDANVIGLLESKIRILDIAIQADQNLDFWLMFWRKDTFNNTDLDVDTFIGAVQLDLATFGKQVGGAGQYYHSLEDVNLDFEDEDGTNELHVSLYNADAAAKNAGATGEVVVFLKYELRG